MLLKVIYVIVEGESAERERMHNDINETRHGK